MEKREIAVVILTKEGSNPLCASPQFRYVETKNGVVMRHGKAATLIPWHRIYEVQYSRV